MVHFCEDFISFKLIKSSKIFHKMILKEIGYIKYVYFSVRILSKQQIDISVNHFFPNT